MGLDFFCNLYFDTMSINYNGFLHERLHCAISFVYIEPESIIQIIKVSSIIKVTVKYIEFRVVDLKKVKIENEVVLNNFTFNFYFINLNIEIYLVLKFDYG